MAFMLISYDIPDDKRRAKIAKTLENFGTRVQYSVFECNLTKTQFAEVRKRLVALVVEADDSIRFYALPSDAVKTIAILGHGTVTEDVDFYWASDMKGKRKKDKG